jgi:glycosyltransferase involved in cell wall biosynthesis
VTAVQIVTQSKVALNEIGSATATTRAQRSPEWIVCVSDLFWDEHWSSEQQLMSRLAHRCNVVYVERPISILSFFTASSDASVGRQFWRFLKGGLRRESETLTVVTLPPVLPFRFIRVVNYINEFVRARSIRRTLEKLNAHDPVLWIYPPDAGRVVGKLGESVSVYYCADDWAANDQWWNRAADIRKREGELGAKVDLIVGTSTKLVQRWRERHDNVLFVANGADVATFSQARDSTLPEPEDLRAIPHPRIGYIGFVDSRLNTSLYEKLSASRPDWSFVILGPTNEMNLDLAQLRKMPNVHFIPGRTRAQLPAYLKNFDVCTIPYVLNTLSESIFPLKLFEYLAAGRPIVTTALPELLPYREYIHVAATADEFLFGLEQSLSDPLPSPSQTFLDENSWDTKAERLWQTLAELYTRSLQARNGVQ